MRSEQQLLRFDWSRAIFRRPVVMISLLTALWLAISLPSLLTYPFPNSDEAWVGSISDRYLTAGQLGSPLFVNFYHYDTNYPIWRGFNLMLAQVFDLFGVGLAQGRAFSTAGAVLGAWLLWVIGYRLYGHGTGLLAAAFYLFSPRVLYMAHLVRPEMWVSAAGLLVVVGFLLVKQSRQWWPAFILGLVAALIVNIYIIVVYWSIAISIAMLVEFRQRMDWPALSVYALGGILGTAFWFFGQLYPDPQVVISQWNVLATAIGSTNRGISFFSTFLPNVIFMIQTGWIGHSRLGPIEMGYTLLAIPALATRHCKADKFVLFLSAMIWLGLFLPFKSYYHFIDVVPAFSLLMAAGIGVWAQWFVKHMSWPKLNAMWAMGILSAPLISGFVLGTALLGWRSREIDYAAYAARVRALVPPGSSVLGDATWWWGVRDHDTTFTFDWQIGLMTQKPLTTDEALLEILRSRQVDIILLDVPDALAATQSSWRVVSMRLYVETYCRSVGVAEGLHGVDMGGPFLRQIEVFSCPAIADQT